MTTYFQSTGDAATRFHFAVRAKRQEMSKRAARGGEAPQCFFEGMVDINLSLPERRALGEQPPLLVPCRQNLPRYRQSPATGLTVGSNSALPTWGEEDRRAVVEAVLCAASEVV